MVTAKLQFKTSKFKGTPKEPHIHKQTYNVMACKLHCRQKVLLLPQMLLFLYIHIPYMYIHIYMYISAHEYTLLIYVCTYLYILHIHKYIHVALLCRSYVATKNVLSHQITCRQVRSFLLLCEQL